MGRLELSWPEYDFLWEHFKLGPRQPILEINTHGYTVDQRAALRAKAWESVAAKGLGDPEGGFDPKLGRWLGLLANPEWEVDARLHLSADGPRTSALIASARGKAVVGVLDAHRLTLAPVSPDSLTRAAVLTLPPHPAGIGTSITLPAETLDAAAARAGADRDAFRSALIGAGLGKAEARKIIDVTGDVIRFGHFGVARTPPFGKRRRAGQVVSVYDNPDGRYLFSRRPSGGMLWVTLVPGTDAAIARQIDELRAELVRG